MRQGQEPVFPIVAGKSVGHYGISTRLYLAGMAMQGMLASGHKTNIPDLTKLALQCADELIKQEEETK